MLRIAVLVSGGGTNLQALLDAEKAGVIRSGHVALVVSDKPGVYALERAESHGVEAVVCDKKSFASKVDFERALMQILDSRGVDLIVLGGFLTVLSAEFVRTYTIINIHPSLIPSFCGDGFYGLRVHRAALERGVKITGATVHYVNEITDGGEIIMQKAVAVREGDTPETLQRRVMEEAEWVILPQAVELVCKKLEGKL